MLVRLSAAYGLLKQAGFTSKLVKSSDGVEVPHIVDALTVIREESQGFVLLRGPVLAEKDAAGNHVRYTVGNKMANGDVTTDDGVAQINAYYWPAIKAFDPLASCQFMLNRWNAKGDFREWSSWKGKRVAQHRPLAMTIHGSWALPSKWASAQPNITTPAPGRRTYVHPLP